MIMPVTMAAMKMADPEVTFSVTKTEILADPETLAWTHPVHAEQFCDRSDRDGKR